MKTKITYILEATTGGTRRHVVDVLMNLDRSRFEPILLCSTLRDADFLHDVAKLRDIDIEVREVPMLRDVDPISDWQCYQQLIEILQRENPDVVHTHSSKAGILGRYAAQKAGVPSLVHTPHVFPFSMECGALKRSLYRALERKASRFTDKIVAVCGDEQELAWQELRVPKPKVSVIHNGIDVNAWSVDDNDAAALRSELGLGEAPTIGMIGRFMPQKGHAVLLKALPQIFESVPDTRVVLVGNGELKSSIRQQVSNLGMSARVLFCDQTDDILPYYGLFDVLVVPSLWEGLPYTILEALAAGTPVVASAVGGIPEIIEDGESGFLVTRERSELFAQCICRVLLEAELRCRIAENGKDRVRQHFGLTKMLDSLHVLYESLTAPVCQ